MVNEKYTFHNRKYISIAPKNNAGKEKSIVLEIFKVIHHFLITVLAKNIDVKPTTIIEIAGNEIEEAGVD